MSTMYPLAIVTRASVTSLVKMTLYHHSTSVFHTLAESAAKEDRDTRLVSDLPGVQAVENQMGVEEAKTKE